MIHANFIPSSRRVGLGLVDKIHHFVYINPMPNYSCTTFQTKDVFVARPKGYFDETAGDSLKNEFEAPIQKGINKFILNIAETSVINSQGITKILELVEFFLYEQKAKFVLVGLSELYLEVFQSIGILDLVKVFPDETQALAEL